MKEIQTYMLVVDETRGEYSVYPILDEVRAMAAIADRQSRTRKLSYTLHKAQNRKEVIALGVHGHPHFHYAVNLLSHN